MTQLGAYVGNSSKKVIQFEDWLGRPVDFVRAHTGRGSWWDYDSSVGWVGSQFDALNKPINWTIPMFAYGGSLDEAAAGSYNDHYIKAAKSILATRSSDDVIYVRFGEEFNGGWMPWAAKGQEQEFIQAFRQMVDSFRSVSDKFKFEWNVNVGHQGMDPAKAYPGDAYVDVIGMDFYYNTAWDPKDPIKAWDYMVKRDYGLQWLEDFAAAHGKPTAYSEWGIKAANAGPYITKAAEWFQSHNVLYQSYWDDNHEMPSKLSDGSIAGNADEAKAYRDAFSERTDDPDNTAPVGDADAYQVSENTTLRIDVSAGVIGDDRDADGDTLLAMLVEGPAHGKLTLNADGSFVYVPDLNYSGPDSFTYAPRDQAGAGNVTKVSLTVAEANNAPASGKPVSWTVGTTGSNTLTGDGRNNSLDGNTGQDTLSGRLGDDTYVVDRPDDKVVELEGQGIDTVQSWSPSSYTLSANVENLHLMGSGQTGTGNQLANGIIGGKGADTLNGKAGNDWLTGGAGADIFVFERGTGHDIVRDFVASGTGRDVVKLSGFDYGSFGAIQAAMTQVGANTLLTLQDGSKVTFLGRTPDDFSARNFQLPPSDSELPPPGSEVPSPIYSISGQPKVEEGGELVFTVTRTADNGAQTVDYRLSGTATAGLDYVAPTGTVTFAKGELSKQIVISTKTDALEEDSEIVLVNLSSVTGSGSIDEDKSVSSTIIDLRQDNLPESVKPTSYFYGSAEDDFLTGNSYNNFINGEGGYDTMKGAKGDDIYIVDIAGDKVIELSSQGIDTVQSWASSYTLSANVENLYLTGTGQTGTGNQLANGITGGKGADTLNGKAGDDRLTGGSGNDTFVFERGTGHDVVRDFVASGTGRDVVKLSGFDYDSFGEVQDAMTQVGANTLLTLQDGSKVTFLNEQVDDFNSEDFIL